MTTVQQLNVGGSRNWPSQSGGGKQSECPLVFPFVFVPLYLATMNPNVELPCQSLPR